MEIYRQKIIDQINQEEIHYQQVISGNFKKVEYQEKLSEEWGKFDENGINRFRLAYYLLLNSIYHEEITVRLFEEEILSRENEDYSGIGDCLNILTVLLNHFNKEHQYDILLQRAQNSNYNCMCGYFPERDYFDCDIGKMTLDDCIWLAYDLDYMELAKELADIYQSNTELNYENCQQIIKYNKWLKCESKNREARLKIFEWDKHSDNSYQRWRAYNDLFHHYIVCQDYHKAYEFFLIFQNAIKQGQIEEYGLDDVIIDVCEIMINYPEYTQELWKFVKPHFKKYFPKSSYLYEKVLPAAQLANPKYARKLRKEYKKYRIP